MKIIRHIFLVVLFVLAYFRIGLGLIIMGVWCCIFAPLISCLSLAASSSVKLGI